MSTPEEELLQNLNSRMAKIHIPTILYTFLCMLVGLVGNVLVIIFYGFKLRATPTYMLIVTLAVYDVTACVTLMPFHLFQLYQKYSWSNESVCHLFVFVTYFVSFGSAVSLLTIAIDRYRKICKPFGRQLSIKGCRFAILFLTLLAVVLTVPFTGVTGSEEVLKRSNGKKFTGHVCVLSSDDDLQTYIISFQAVLYFLFLSSILVLIILYALIRKRLFSRPNFHSQKSTSAGKRHDVRQQPPEANENTNAAVMSISKDQSTKTTQLEKCENQAQQQRNATRKYTVLMLAITAAFILSYLPYLALIASTFIFGTRWINSSTVGYVFYTIGMRSFLINSACNPVIYGFMNTEFRGFLSSLLCRFCRCKQKKRTGSSDKSPPSTSTDG